MTYAWGWGGRWKEIVPEEAQKLNLLDKASKSISDIFTMLKKSVDKELKEIMNIMSH